MNAWLVSALVLIASAVSATACQDTALTGKTSDGGGGAGMAGTGGIAGGGGSGGSAGDCTTAFCARGISCVTACGARPSYNGCCPCPAPTFDDFACGRPDAPSDGGRSDAAPPDAPGSIDGRPPPFSDAGHDLGASGSGCTWHFDDMTPGTRPPGFQTLYGTSVEYVVQAEPEPPSAPNVLRFGTGTTATLLAPGVRPADVTVRVACELWNPSSSRGTPFCGLVARASGQNHVHVRVYDPPPRTSVEFSGEPVTMRSQAKPSGGPGWHVLELTTRGSLYTVSLDGQVIATATGTVPPAPGQVGFYGKGPSGFDDLECLPSDAPPSGCGAPGQPCCPGDSCAGAGTRCDSGRCRACGGRGQACCAGATCLDPGDGCAGASPCPAGAPCHLPIYAGACRACGLPGQPCCTGSRCAGGGCCFDNRCVADGAQCLVNNGSATYGLCQGGRCPCGRQGEYCCPPETLQRCLDPSHSCVTTPNEGDRCR